MSHANTFDFNRAPPRARRPEPRGQVMIVAPNVCSDGSPYSGHAYECVLARTARKCQAGEYCEAAKEGNKVEKGAPAFMIHDSKNKARQKPDTSCYHPCCVMQHQLQELQEKYARADIVKKELLAPEHVDAAGKPVPVCSKAEFDSRRDPGNLLRAGEMCVVDFEGHGKYFYRAQLGADRGDGTFALAYDFASAARRAKFSPRRVLEGRCSALPQTVKDTVVTALYSRLKTNSIEASLVAKVSAKPDLQEDTALCCAPKGPKAPRPKKEAIVCVACGGTGHKTARSSKCPRHKKKAPKLERLDVSAVVSVATPTLEFDAEKAKKIIDFRKPVKPEKQCTCGLIPCLCEDEGDDADEYEKQGKPEEEPAAPEPVAPEPVAPEPKPKPKPEPLPWERKKSAPTSRYAAEDDDEDAGEYDEDEEDMDEDDRAFINDGDEYDTSYAPVKREYDDYDDYDARPAQRRRVVADDDY